MEFGYHLLLEFNQTVFHCVQSIINTGFDVFACVEFGAVLANNNLAGFNGLVPEYFNA